MANRSEAYDFSLFEERYDNTAPLRGPQKGSQPKKDVRQNVVELPERELKKNARPQRHPFRAMAATACFAVIFATVVSVVYSQVQLTELTEQINTAATQLEEAQSLEIQLNMKAAREMNGSQVEEYAVNQLGMSKITGTQVTYVNVAQEDEGTVVQDVDGGSVLDQIMATIRSWFA